MILDNTRRHALVIRGFSINYCDFLHSLEIFSSKMSEELLIEFVRRYPVLYDTSLTQYRDSKLRNNAWEEIAVQLNTTIEEVKDKWVKLRNCFTNAVKRRRKKNGRGINTMNPWKFEVQMEFLLPHLANRRSCTNLQPLESDIKYEESTQGSVLQFSPESTPALSYTAIRTPTPSSSPSPTTSPRDKNHDENNLFKYMVNDMKSTQELGQKRALITELDENDHFFLSMSKQLNKLPKTDQAEIKFQLHKLIHEAEMKMLNHFKGGLNT